MAFIRFKISYPPSYYKFLDLLCIIEKNDNYYLAHTYIFSISLYIYIYFISTSILYHKWFDEIESNIPVKFRKIWKKKERKGHEAEYAGHRCSNIKRKVITNVWISHLYLHRVSFSLDTNLERFFIEHPVQLRIWNTNFLFWMEPHLPERVHSSRLRGVHSSRPERFPRAKIASAYTQR